MDFGPVLYEALTKELKSNGHRLIDHQTLINSLREAAKGGDKQDRVRAVQALRYASRRREGLVIWSLDHSLIDRKNVFEWTRSKISPYFQVV